MKSGFFIFITFLFFAFTFSCTTISSSENEIKCINRIIALDDSLGKIRNHACKIVSLSESITQYHMGIKENDLNDCPEEFKKAFFNHQLAWKDIKIITDKYPDLRGEMHTLFDSIEKGKDSTEFKKYLSNIWATWTIIESAVNTH